MVHFVSQIAWGVSREIFSAAKHLFPAFLLFAASFMPAQADSVSTNWQSGIPDSGILAYEITRKGKRLGFQTLDFKNLDNGDLQVDIHIEIDFAIIIPLFRYLHDNREIWRDGKMLSLASKTDNNGESEFVDLRAQGDVFVGRGTKFADDLTARDRKSVV